MRKQSILIEHAQKQKVGWDIKTTGVWLRSNSS